MGSPPKQEFSPIKKGVSNRQCEVCKQDPWPNLKLCPKCYADRNRRKHRQIDEVWVYDD